MTRSREEMVRQDIAARGVADERVLAAMRTVPRETFVPGGELRRAHDDIPLGIGHGQTISQPYVVARMLEVLELAPDSRMLEVGAGSGYAAALAGQLCAAVVGVERIAALAAAAADCMGRLGYDNVRIVAADGTEGWPYEAPYDAILVSAAAEAVPPALLRQLRVGGRLVAPVGPRHGQRLLRFLILGDGPAVEDLGPVAFVPLIGADRDRTEPAAGPN